MGLPGIVREHPNFRDAPTSESNIPRVLEPGIKLDVLGRDGDYYEVVLGGRTGYVHVEYVLPDAGGPAPGQASQPVAAVAPPAVEPSMLEAPAASQVSAQSTVGRIWNRYGGLLKPLSESLGFDPAVAVAVLAVESGGRALGPEGRMVIRFENHIFYDQWGRLHPDTYQQFLAFDPGRRWEGHRWRPAAEQEWRACHQSQAGEWEVLDFARAFDDTAAKRSISMGLTQIMGFNHADIGYGSVQEMFDAFSTDLRNQIAGFFSYVRSRMGIQPLRDADYFAFARIYNGIGQEVLYSKLIADAVAEFKALSPGV